jgi:hypothetical protein
MATGSGLFKARRLLTLTVPSPGENGRPGRSPLFPTKAEEHVAQKPRQISRPAGFSWWNSWPWTGEVTALVASVCIVAGNHDKCFDLCASLADSL